MSVIRREEEGEKRVVSRPYGVAMLIAGIDKDGKACDVEKSLFIIILTLIFI